MTSDRLRPFRGKLADAAFRHARAKRAGEAARRTFELRRLALGAKYPTKGHAFAAGYSSGYRQAARWWRQKLERERRRSAA